MVVNRGGEINDDSAAGVFKGVDFVEGEEGVGRCIFRDHATSRLGDDVEERLTGGIPGEERAKEGSRLLANVSLPDNKDEMVGCAEETVKIGWGCVSNICEDGAGACFGGDAEDSIYGRFGGEVEDIIVDRTIGAEGWMCGGATGVFEEGVCSLIGGNLDWFQRYRIDLLEIVAVGRGDKGVQWAAERRCVAGQSWVISDIRDVDVSTRCVAVGLNSVAEGGFEGTEDDLAWIRPETAAR